MLKHETPKLWELSAEYVSKVGAVLKIWLKFEMTRFSNSGSGFENSASLSSESNSDKISNDQYLGVRWRGRCLHLNLNLWVRGRIENGRG